MMRLTAVLALVLALAGTARADDPPIFDELFAAPIVEDQTWIFFGHVAPASMVGQVVYLFAGDWVGEAVIEEDQFFFLTVDLGDYSGDLHGITVDDWGYWSNVLEMDIYPPWAP